MLIIKFNHKDDIHKVKIVHHSAQHGEAPYEYPFPFSPFTFILIPPSKSIEGYTGRKHCAFCKGPAKLHSHSRLTLHDLATTTIYL